MLLYNDWNQYVYDQDFTSGELVEAIYICYSSFYGGGGFNAFERLIRSREITGVKKALKFWVFRVDNPFFDQDEDLFESYQALSMFTPEADIKNYELIQEMANRINSEKRTTFEDPRVIDFKQLKIIQAALDEFNIIPSKLKHLICCVDDDCFKCELSRNAFYHWMICAKDIFDKHTGQCKDCKERTISRSRLYIEDY